MPSFNILATGQALPSSAVTAEELDRRLNLPSGHSFAKSGVRVRHFIHAEGTQAELGALALKDALSRSNICADDIDMLICASAVPQQALPNTAGAIARAAGVPEGVSCMDVNQSCLSFLAALQVASALLACNQYQRIAIVSVDIASRGLNWNEPEASYIFGDGAAAVILEQGTAASLKAYHSATFPSGRHYCQIPGGGSQVNPARGAQPSDFLFHMDGKAVFRAALTHLPQVLQKTLSMANLTLKDIDWVVPHQASHLAMEHAIRKLGFNEEQVINIYPTHGNQVAASMPTALHHLLAHKNVKQGDTVLLIGTAAGLTISAGVLVL